MNGIVEKTEDIDLHHSNSAVGGNTGELESDPQFPVDCLPAGMCDIVEAVSALERTPAGISACCALGIISASLGSNLRIHSHPQKICPANLYIMPAIRSGSNKTETFKPITAPLLKFEAERIAVWSATQLPQILTELEIVTSRIKKLKRDFEKSTAPTLDRQQELQKLIAQQEQLKTQTHAPRLIAENATSEALQLLLVKNGGVITSISSDSREVADVILGRYRSKGTDEGIYLKGFSLESYTSDRVGRGNVTIKEVCISALWLIQPDKLAEMIGKRSLSEGGLLPRFLMYYADFLPTPIDRNASTISKQILQNWETIVHDLLRVYRLGTTLHILNLDPGAIQLLDDHYALVLDRRSSELKSLNEYASRWNEQAWRLGAVLHAALHGSNAHLHTVSADTAQSAITIADWFADRQLSILGWSTEIAKKEMRNRVVAIASQHPDDGITAADIYHKRVTPNAEKARDILNELEKSGVLRADRIPRPGGGWLSERYFRV
jgi:hypothetical protein